MSTVVLKLHIGREQTTLTPLAAGGPDAAVMLDLGAQRIAREYFHHLPPTPDEMETAIMLVEDEITRIRHTVPAGSRLVSDDEPLYAIALLAGVTQSAAMILSREAIERTFDRLARVINGRPASVEGLPDERDFAATLLILREFMHHLAFEEIVVEL